MLRWLKYFYRSSRIALSILLGLLLISPSVVQALPQSHKEAIDRDSVHYVLPSENTGGDACSSDTINLTGNSNVAKAFNYFINDKGLTPEQAAGIVGNLYAESGVIPNRKQGTGASEGITSPSQIVPNVGFGIAQWTSAGRQQNWLNYAKEKNMDPLTLELELMFLWHELETTPSYGLSEIKKAGDIRQSAWVFLVYFERPAATSGFEEKPQQATSGTAKAELDKRESYAKGVLSKGQDGSVSPVSDSSGCGGILTGDESTPDFKANPKVQVDDPKNVPFNETQCSGNFTPGAASLSKLVIKTYSPPVTSVGGYSCRKNTADDSISVHGLGRALDIMIDGTTPKGLEVGDRIRNYMINNSTQLGIQRVIWNRHIWSADQDGWRTYTGPVPHTDHLHVEINIKASQNQNLGGSGNVSI